LLVKLWKEQEASEALDKEVLHSHNDNGSSAGTICRDEARNDTTHVQQ